VFASLASAGRQTFGDLSFGEANEGHYVRHVEPNPQVRPGRAPLGRGAHSKGRFHTGDLQGYGPFLVLEWSF
jgi:hypothetical protein